MINGGNVNDLEVFLHEQCRSKYLYDITNWTALQKIKTLHPPMVTLEDVMQLLHRCYLRVHIVKGCLSGIPKGLGTNHNERLHRLLNKSAMCVSRISTHLAKALRHGIFYVWNQCKQFGTCEPLWLTPNINAPPWQLTH
jgi:hypothetical protein